MAAKKKAKAVKVRKKKWVPVMAPKLFNNVHLGDTHVGEDEEVLRKGMTLNLSTVMSDMRKQGYLARFDIVKLHEGKAYAALTGLVMTPSGTKRLIRRGRSKVEDSFLARMKDGRVVRVKPLIVTINRCSKAAQTSIRLAVREKLKEVLAGTDLDGFVNEIIGVKIQRILKDLGNQHHPTRSADIKAIQLLPKHKEGLDTEVEQKEAPQEAEKPVADEKPVEEKSEEKPKKTAKKAAKKTPKAEEPEEKPEGSKDDKSEEPKTEEPEKSE